MLKHTIFSTSAKAKEKRHNSRFFSCRANMLYHSKLSPLSSFLWTRLINFWRIHSAKVLLITRFFINRSSLINYFSNWCFLQFKWNGAISVTSHMKSRGVPHTIDVKVMAHQRWMQLFPSHIYVNYQHHEWKDLICAIFTATTLTADRWEVR